MMARRLPGILPPLTFDEALDVTAVHSVAGLLPAGAGLVTRRPFRAPHHTISDAALVGGGTRRVPARSAWLITACCFSTRCRSSAGTCSRCCGSRSKKVAVTIARAARTAIFPARFMLVGAMNPCPCGYMRRRVRRDAAARRSRSTGTARGCRGRCAIGWT